MDYREVSCYSECCATHLGGRSLTHICLIRTWSSLSQQLVQELLYFCKVVLLGLCCQNLSPAQVLVKVCIQNQFRGGDSLTKAGVSLLESSIMISCSFGMQSEWLLCSLPAGNSFLVFAATAGPHHILQPLLCL